MATISNPIDWKFNTPKFYIEKHLRTWSQPHSKVNFKMLEGNGENGTSFKRVNSSDSMIQKILKKHNYNLIATEMMSLHRTLPDYRSKECREIIYPKKLPTASLILIFHNEAWSLIFRTVWSIINRSPGELIEEIILVDDVSTWPVLKRPLEDYIELLPIPVKLIRTKKREGLIRARLIGGRAAKVNKIDLRSN